VIYPFSFKNRVEFTGSYQLRDFKGSIFVNAETGVFGDCELNTPFPSRQCEAIIEPREDDYPQIGATFISDSTIFNQWGPVAGHRLRIGGSYAPDFDESGTLTSSLFVDARQYIPLTRRSNFAFRFVGQASSGNFPDINFLGGLDTLRGVDFRALSGTRSFFANIEFRFPLIDQLAFPGFGLGGIRGVFFVDVGGAWYHEVVDFDFYNSDEGRLEDAIASVGWGVSTRILGVSANWDVARLTRFGDNEDNSFETNFWIGTRF
jgi:hypothetical protein